ncbi:MAG: glycosyltransferase family 4 protein [Thermodesulfobacteriota bacterium]
MKIAHVIATFPPYHGGMGYICYHNARVLADRGHDVTVFTLEHGRLGYEADPTTFRIERMKPLLLYGDAGMVPSLVSKLTTFDMVHLHYPFFGGAEYVYWGSIVKGKPYFLTYHMDVHGDTPLKKAVIRCYEPLFLKRIVQQAAGICSPGIPYLKSTKAAAFIPWHRHTDVMYGGVDTQLFQPTVKNHDIIRQHQLEGKTVVLFVGNLIPFKGLHLLIEAIGSIPESSIVLLIVGGGYHEAEYRNKVNRSRLQERVIFAGPQSPQGLLTAYYNIADFLVLPSTHSESFGLVVLEAMASGKPVIVSALPGPSQLIDPGKDGYAVPIGDVEALSKAIMELAGAEKRRNKMGEAARRKVLSHYSWERIGAQLESVYRGIIRNSTS